MPSKNTLIRILFSTQDKGHSTKIPGQRTQDKEPMTYTIIHTPIFLPVHFEHSKKTKHILRVKSKLYKGPITYALKTVLMDVRSHADNTGQLADKSRNKV